MKVRLLALLVMMAGAACPAHPKTLSPRGFASAPLALADAKAAALLPNDTLFFAVAKSPQALSDSLGWVAAFKAQGDGYEQAVAKVVKVAGVNLLDPKSLTEVGLDPEAPFGLALLPASKMGVVAFATLTDAEKFKTFLYRSAGLVHMEFEPHTRGQALVLLPKNDTDTAWVLRDDQLFFVFTDRPRDREPVLDRLTAVTKERSLASSPRFRQVASDVRGSVGMYVAFDQFFAQELERHGKRAVDDSTLRGLERELADARKNGVDKATLAELTAQLDNERGWYERRVRGQVGERALVDGLLVAAGPVAIGVVLGEKAVRVQARFTPRPQSLLDQLLSAPGGRLAVLGVSSQNPDYLMALRADPGHVLAFLRAVVAADGDDPDALRAEGRDRIGVDTDEVLRLLSGELGMSITLGDWLKPSFRSDAFWEEIGAHFVAGISDEAAAKRLLVKVAKKLSVPMRADGSLTVPIALGMRLRAEVVAGYLVVSTHDAAQRVARGAAPFASGKEEQSLFAGHNLNAAFLLDATVLSTILWGAWRHTDEAVDSGAWVAAPANASKAYQAKRKEVDTLRAEMEERRRARRQREAERAQAIVTAVGRTTLVAQRVGNTVEISGGQFFGPGGKRGLWEAIFAAIFAPSEKYDGEAYERLRRAEDALRVLEDAERGQGGAK